jgi:signal transduction histidine kinase
MTPYALPDLVAFSINMIFGIFVYRRNPRVLVNRVFAILMASICIWQFCELNLVNASRPETALFWDRSLYLGLILAPTLTFILALIFPRPRALLKHPYKVLILIPCCILLLFLPTNLFVAGIQKEYWGFGKITGPLYWVFRVYFAVFMALTLATFYDSCKTARTTREKLQSKYLMCAIAIPGIIGVIILTIFQPLRLNALNTSVAPLASVLGTAILTFAIAKHRLMDIDIALKKSTVYLTFLAAILLPALLLITVVQHAVLGGMNHMLTLSIAIVLSLCLISFLLFYPYLERTVRERIVDKKYLYRSSISNFSKEIVTIIDLECLFRSVVQTLADVMGVEKCSIFVLDERKKRYVLRAAKNGIVSGLDGESSFSQNDSLIQWLERNKEVIIRDEWDVSTCGPEMRQVIATMETFKSEVSVPLIEKSKLIGFINLGKKPKAAVYLDEDIELLQVLGSQTAIAIENGWLYDNLKKQKSAMRRADRLAALGTLAAGLAHEIRNPLVAIKTLADLLPERLDDEEFRNGFVRIASAEVDRISSLLNDLLHFARPSEPQLTIEDVSKIMEETILLLSIQLKKKGLEIIRQYEEDLPPIAIDREQIKQVFLNMLMNATDAVSEEGRIKVEISRATNGNGKEVLQIGISDTGAGIDEADLENIFIPFFTTKEKGSGLGLPISNQIIEEHKGTINVTSHVGEGSSFVITLPIPEEIDKARPSLESNRSNASSLRSYMS